MNKSTGIKETRLGDTKIKTTQLGLGLAALGRPGYINLGHAEDLNGNYNIKAMEEHCHKVLDLAWARGVRYFDAARSYGRAEAFLSSWLVLRNIQSDQLTVGSKWGYTYTANWQIEAQAHEIKEHSVEVLQRQWQESREHLGKWIKLYQIHSATIDSGVLENSKVLAELADIKSHNVAIGLSLSGSRQSETLEKALAVAIDGHRLFDVVQATWNILETSAGTVLEQAHQQGMGVIIKEGLANGRLTQRNDEADFQKKKKKLLNIANKNNCTIDALALAYILQKPWVDIVLSGAATAQQLESNLKALDLKDLPDIDIHEEADEYWNRRSDLSWN